MVEAIKNRRSIRRFLPDPVPREALLEIIRAGMLAPSSKNRQPWRFTVVQGAAKGDMLEVFRRGLEREERGPGLLPLSREHLPGARSTAAILAQAPAVIFVSNALGEPLEKPLSLEERVAELCNVQSIGGAIQNMLLAAEDLGLGSLWVGDLYFAYPELYAWLGCGGQLTAAVALGYPAESPPARPRLAPEDLVAWRG